MADSMPSSLVMDRSDSGVRVSVSVAVSLVGLGSVTPGGGVTVAVLVRLPVAEGSMWTVKLKVTVALTGKSTVVARAPVPLLGPLTLPPPLLSISVQLAVVTPVGRVGHAGPGHGAGTAVADRDRVGVERPWRHRGDVVGLGDG